MRDYSHPRGHAKSMSLRKCPFFDPPPPHVTLCHLFVSTPSPPCHSSKSDKLCSEKVFMFSYMSIPSDIKKIKWAQNVKTNDKNRVSMEQNLHLKSYERI